MRIFASARSQPTPAPAADGVVRIDLAALLALAQEAQGLALEPRRVNASMPGAYRSPFRGRGMEFDEVRPYVAGDDVRSIDWRVTARSGRVHTKLYREERERAVLVWVDLRPAMFFATRGAFKAVRAAQAAALLAWSTLSHSDRLGLLVFDERHHLELKPRRGRAALVRGLGELARHPAWQGAVPADPPRGLEAMNQALGRLDRVVHPGSLVALVSDLSILEGDGPSRLMRLARHSDVVLATIEDPLEAELPPPGTYRVGDGRRFVALDTGDEGLRERYRRLHAERQEALKALCLAHGILHIPLSTAQAPIAGLRRALGGRP